MTTKQADDLDAKEAGQRLAREPISALDPSVYAIRPCADCGSGTVFLRAALAGSGRPLCGDCERAVAYQSTAIEEVET